MERLRLFIGGVLRPAIQQQSRRAVPVFQTIRSIKPTKMRKYVRKTLNPKNANPTKIYI